MSEERSAAGAGSFSAISVGGPSGELSESKRRKSSVVVVTEVTASVVKGALPGQIDQRHYNVGAGLWLLLCLGFVGYSIYSIWAMYHGRKNPATAFSYEDENWNFPNVAVCPMAGSWALWTMVAAGYKRTTESQYTGISDPDYPNGQNIVSFTNKAGDDCILIRYDNLPNENFTVTTANQSWEATADVTFMTHAHLTELNTPKRVRVNYVQDSAYKEYKAAHEKNNSVKLDDYYTEPHDYYLPYGLGYVTSAVKFLNVLEYKPVQSSDSNDDAAVASFSSTGTSLSQLSGSYLKYRSDDSSIGTATSHAEDSYHPLYSTAFDRYFYVSSTTTTSYYDTYMRSSGSGRPYSSSYYGGRRWRMHDFESGYYVKKDDNDVWKTVSYDNIMTLGKQVVEQPFSPTFKDVTFPTGIAATPQFVDVRTMEFFAGGTDGTRRTYRDRVVTGQNVTYLCDKGSNGDETDMSWQLANDTYEVEFLIRFPDAGINQRLEMNFIGWELYDYLLGPAYAFDPEVRASNHTTNRTSSVGEGIHLIKNETVHYWPLIVAELSLKDAFFILACYNIPFGDDPDTSSSWLWEGQENPDSATPVHCLLRESINYTEWHATADVGARRLASRFEAGDAIAVDDFVQDLFHGDAAAAAAAVKAVQRDMVAAKASGPSPQPKAPWFFAGDLNRHRSEAKREVAVAGPGRSRRLADGGSKAGSNSSVTIDDTGCTRDLTGTTYCLKQTFNLYGGAYYLYLYDSFVNGWLRGGATITVAYRRYGTNDSFTVAKEVDGSPSDPFVHENGREKFTRQFIIGDRIDDYAMSFPCETSLGLTDATAFHLQYLSFTIQNQSPQVQHITAIDPVDWFAMLGTIGGFWAYVAMVFGVVFVAVAGDDAPPEPVWTMRSQFRYIYDKVAARFARLKYCRGKPVASVSPAKSRDPSLSNNSILAYSEETKAEGGSATMAPAFEPESKAGDLAV